MGNVLGALLVYTALVYLLAGCDAFGIKKVALKDKSQKAKIECMDGVNTIWNEDDKKQRDILWTEVVTFLSSYSEALTKQADSCGSIHATTSTHDAQGGKTTNCLDEFRDLTQMARHIQVVVKNQDQAKACFDPTMAGVEAVSRGYTPHADMVEGSSVSAWLGRDLFSSLSAPEGATNAFQSFASDFSRILGHAEKASHFKDDITIHGLPHLWKSAPWIPMYLSKEEAGNLNFRAGYAYAEIMGPWGLLRVDTIDGERFQGEVGITIQRAGTFYPGHFHNPQEIYMTLTKPSCPDQNRYMLLDEMGTTAENGNWEKTYISMDNEKEWALYINRNDIHSFIAGDCDGRAKTSGLVTAWARTMVRDGMEQKTRLCESKNGILPNITPEESYTCAIESHDKH